MDRIHRLGQHRPIIVKRMIIENSIESRIIELQNKKSAMVRSALALSLSRFDIRCLRLQSSLFCSSGN